MLDRQVSLCVCGLSYPGSHVHGENPTAIDTVFWGPGDRSITTTNTAGGRGVNRGQLKESAEKPSVRLQNNPTCTQHAC